MIDSNNLNKAFRSYDSAKVVAALDKEAMGESIVARKFVTALRQSSCLAIRISFSNAMPHVSGGICGVLRSVATSHNAFYVDSGRELPRSAAAFPEAGENKRGERA